VQNIDPTILANIAQGAYASTTLLLFNLPEGMFGFWGGYGTINVNGIDYVGAGTLIEIAQLNMGTDLSASPITCRLRAVPETELTPDVLASIDDYAYKNRPAHLTLAYFDRVSGVLVTAIQWWQGFIDVIEHDQTVGGEYVLTARLEPLSLDHSRTGYRMRSDTDQRLIDPVDRFFEHAAITAMQSIPYGRKEDGTSDSQGLGGTSGGGGGGGRDTG
jgi:hypothetical protein